MNTKRAYPLRARTRISVEWISSYYTRMSNVQSFFLSILSLVLARRIATMTMTACLVWFASKETVRTITCQDAAEKQLTTLITVL